MPSNLTASTAWPTPQLQRFIAHWARSHLEFQTTVAEDDLPRFYHAQFAAGEHYGTQVHTVVIYGAGTTSAPAVLDRGSGVYTVRQVFLGTQDGEAVVRLLRERIAAGEPLTDAERVRLMLLPLMRQQRTLLEVLREVAGLARALPQTERDETMGALVGLAYNVRPVSLKTGRSRVEAAVSAR